MTEEPLSPHEPVLDGAYTVEQCSRDYRNAFTDLGRYLEEAMQSPHDMERLKAEHIRHIQEETKHGVERVMNIVGKLWKALTHITDYRQHLTQLFQRYGYEDAALIQKIEKSHPCKKELKRITSALRGMAHRKEADIERMSVLFRMAMYLAGASKPLDSQEKKSLSEVTSKRKWKRRMKHEEVAKKGIEAVRSMPE